MPQKWKLFVEFVDPWLTSIYHPLDAVMNAPFKRLVWHEYHDYINSIVQDIFTPSKFKPGDKINISIETLIGFVEKSHGDINGDNTWKRIAKSFNKCWINTWGYSKQFHQHLDHINKSDM